MQRAFLILISFLGAIGCGFLAAYYPLYLLPAVLLLGVLYYALSSVNALFYVAFVVLVLGQIGRIPPGSASGDILVLDGLVTALALCGLLLIVSQKKTKFVTSRAHYAWLGFLAVAGISFLFAPVFRNQNDWLVNGFYYIRLLSYSSILWIVPAFFKGELSSKRLLQWLLGSGLVITLLGFVQLYLLPDIGSLSKYGWDPHVGRLVSTFLDPNYLGGYLAILLALVAAWAKVTQKWQYLLLVPFLVLAGVLTYSRSGYLALALVLVVVAISYSWKVFLIAVVCIVPLALAIPRVRIRVVGGFSLDTTAQDRIESWQNALEVSNVSPIIGIGYNNYRTVQENLGIIRADQNSRASAGSDSSLLNVYATTGVIGLILFLLAGGSVLRRAFRIAKAGQSTAQRIAAHTLLFATPGLFIHSFFVNSFFYPFILFPLLCLVALLYVSQES